jgi:hypothetical protein
VPFGRFKTLKHCKDSKLESKPSQKMAVAKGMPTLMKLCSAKFALQKICMPPNPKKGGTVRKPFK